MGAGALIAGLCAVRELDAVILVPGASGCAKPCYVASSEDILARRFRIDIDAHVPCPFYANDDALLCMYLRLPLDSSTRLLTDPAGCYFM